MCKQKICKQGKICIPYEIFQKLNMAEQNQVELTIEYGHICIRPFTNTDIKSRSNVGIVRKYHSCHRIVIPNEYLKLLNISIDTKVNCVCEDEKIVLIAD